MNAATWYSLCGFRRPPPDVRFPFTCALAPWRLIPGAFGLITVLTGREEALLVAVACWDPPAASVIG